MSWEIKKILNIFNLIIVILLVLYTGRMIYTQANLGRHYAYEETSYYATGKELREKDKELAKKYTDRVVNEEFFIDFDHEVAEGLALDKNGNARFETWLYGTSLYEYTEFFKLGQDYMSGDAYTDTAAIFAIDNPVYSYTEGWNVLNNCIPLLAWTVTFGCIIIFSSFVSNEYSSGMIMLIHPSKNGRKQTAINKYMAALLLSSAIYIILIIVMAVIVMFIWGTENPTATIQLLSSGKYISLAEEMSCIKLISYRILCGWLNLCSAIGITMAISALSDNSYISVVLSLGTYYFPYLFELPKNTFSILSFLPYNICNAFSNNWTNLGYSTYLLFMYLLATIIWCGLSLWLCISKLERYPLKKNGK